MTGRGASTDDEQDDHGRGSGRLLLVAALALALVAAAVLVLSDSARMLRLAVVAALWAALVGAFLAARYRRQVTERDDEVADLQSVYELELEREVAARREYELEIESETRKRIEEESRADIEALRADLHALRDNLQALLGGDVLVERVALRAESTRLRSLGSEAARLTAAPEQRVINAKPVITATSSVTSEKPSERTELIERVAQDAKMQPPRREQARPEPVRPDPARNSPRPQPAVVRREPVKAPKQQEPPRPQPRPASAAAAVSARLGGATPAPQKAPPPPTVKAQPVQAQVHRTERVQRPQQPPARPEPMQRPEQPPKAPAAVAKSVETRKPEPRSRVAERTEMIDPKALATGGGRRRADDRQSQSQSPAPVQDSGSWETLKPDAPSPGRRSDERPSRRTASEDSLVSLPPVSRRSAAEQSSARLPAVSPGRRSPADETPVSGRRVAEDSSTRLPAVSTGRRAAPEDPSGAHADGKSVSELLASLGGGDAPRRRRRRDD
ncbi:DUF6779 domain-containing protein [Lentzea sp. BCCO 10_0798]|uniref:DUF6779 domain-containing protein n=1 Tax=Lentzea kristufekii TaxID=3095430 RepID=A0ABU4TTY9_9PSEU|nr:DUF6779 domain-containing protein [Lentzea sp. BCCO 10_0798]MDX8051387.1 DUF6779 domain-containing protein [Lentzea sp. BCCO 10_0798]